MDCADPGKTYAVIDESGELDSAYANATRFASYPGESIYMELKGIISEGNGNSERILTVSNIIRSQAKNFRTACYPYEFIALGNEPFWSLDIIPAEKRIVLKDMSIEKIFDFDYKAATKNADTYAYELKNRTGDIIKVSISKEVCSDGMSDRRYTHSSEININGRVLKGCAIKKGEHFPDPV
jgi:uncharacterized membrane protein